MNQKEISLWNRILAIDLSPIRFKLVNCDEGAEPWSIEKVLRVEPTYRQYLFLTEIAGDSASVVPTVEIDQMWHTHILDTQKYAVDCDIMFGHFLHHFPYLGMRGAEDKERLHSAFAETGNLFAKYFKHMPQGYTVSADPAYCGDTGSCGGCDHRGITSRPRPRLDLVA